MEVPVKLVGSVGLCGLIIWVGYLVFEKNLFLSVTIMAIGIGLAIFIIIREFGSKKGKESTEVS